MTLNTTLTPEQWALYQDPAEIRRLLDQARTIAIVGLSSDRQRASYFVASYLQDEGYRIVPVNPKAEIILGEKVYPDLLSIPFALDLIDIFRLPQDMPPIIDQAIARKEKGLDPGGAAVWMQLKLTHLPAAEKARAAGLVTILDKCVKMEHGRYRGGLHFAGMNTEIITARKRR